MLITDDDGPASTICKRASDWCGSGSNQLTRSAPTVRYRSSQWAARASTSVIGEPPLHPRRVVSRSSVRRTDCPSLEQIVPYTDPPVAISSW